MTLGISGITRSTGNFVKGNVAGATAATFSALIARPVIGCIRGGHPQIKNSNMIGNMNYVLREKASLETTSLIKQAYTKYGAPKSGEFFTQTLGEIAQKAVKFLAGKK